MRTVRWLAVVLVLASWSARSAPTQLVDNGDGTVTDLQTGLMWLKNANLAGMTMTHADAVLWAQNLVFAGYDDWRLPSGANPDGTVCNSRPTGANCTRTEFASLYFTYTIQVFNPGPFQNLQYRNYWTSTEWPTDPTRAMAQDFEDGGQNDFPKTDHYWAWAVRTAGIPPGTPTLYGVISQDPNLGYLIKINIITGAVTLVGNTGLQQPCALTYDAYGAVLYVNECFGTAGVYTVDPATAATTPLGGPPVGQVMAYRFVDNLLYGIYNDIDYATLSQFNPQTGAPLGIVGQINKGPVTALTVRPSDGQLIGAGYANLFSEKWLFSIATTPGSSPLEHNLTALDWVYTGLAYHPNGTLYGTDGTKLFTVNQTTGSRTFIGSFGPTIGTVSGLAIVAPGLPRRPDVWIKDCLADNGAVPSAPLPCATWTNSPDIRVTNSVGPYPVGGVPNQVRATVRNRGIGGATGAVARFYYGQPGTTTDLSSTTPIGQATVTVPALGQVFASIVWTPPLRVNGSTSCIGVVLAHPADPPIQPFPPPPLDNNVAVRCWARLWVGAGPFPPYRFSFGRGDGYFGFRQWRGEFMFRAQSNLPEGWRWSFEGIELDRPIVLRPGEERTAQLVINVPRESAPHSGGTIDLMQVDDRTGRTIAAMQWIVTADSRPPESPRNVTLAVRERGGRGGTVVTWDPVAREFETGLDEQIAYYEVLRDGRVVATVVTDADSTVPGIQWVDVQGASPRSVYTVRAVDLAGNASQASSPAIPRPQRRRVR